MSALRLGYYYLIHPNFFNFLENKSQFIQIYMHVGTRLSVLIPERIGPKSAFATET